MDLKRMLRKKQWSGRDLGRVIVASLCVRPKKRAQPRPISEEQTEEILKTFKREDMEDYFSLLKLYEWIDHHCDVSQIYFQQAQHRLEMLIGYTTNFTIAENSYQFISELPLIVTQKQYEESKRKAIEEKLTLVPENGATPIDIEADVFFLILTALAHYMRLLETAPEEPNPLRDINELYITKPVETDRLLSNWNLATGQGYFSLPDGRRSDQMDAKEWQALLLPSEDMKLKIDSKIEAAKALFSGATEEEAEEISDNWILDQSNTPKMTWHYYEEPPKDLCKWDVLEEYDAFFPVLQIDNKDPEEGPQAEAEARENFKAEFPELVEALLKDIDRTFFTGREGISDIPLEKWGEPVCTLRELYDQNFYSFREKVESKSFPNGRTKATGANGVAILQEPFNRRLSRRIDKNGYYIPAEATKLFNEFQEQLTLEALFPESEQYAHSSARIAKARDIFLKSIYRVMGYNTFLDLLSKQYRLPEIKESFYVDIEAMLNAADGVNGLVALLYYRINSIEYLNEEIKKKKLQTLRDVFPDIPHRSLAIPERKIKKAKALLKEYKAFSFDKSQAETFHKMQGQIEKLLFEYDPKEPSE